PTGTRSASAERRRLPIQAVGPPPMSSRSANTPVLAVTPGDATPTERRLIDEWIATSDEGRGITKVLDADASMGDELAQYGEALASAVRGAWPGRAAADAAGRVHAAAGRRRRRPRGPPRRRAGARRPPGRARGRRPGRGGRRRGPAGGQHPRTGERAGRAGAR